MSLPQIKRPYFTHRQERASEHHEEDYYFPTHRVRYSLGSSNQLRQNMLTQISSISKKVSEIESRIVEKLRIQSKSQRANSRMLTVLKPNRTLPHPIVLSTLINAFYGNTSKIKPIKLVQKYQTSVAARQNREPQSIKHRSFQIYDLPQTVLQSRGRSNDCRGNANEKDTNSLKEKSRETLQNIFSLLDKTQTSKTDHTNHPQINRRVLEPIRRTGPFKLIEFSPSNNFSPSQTKKNQRDEKAVAHMLITDDHYPITSSFSKEERNLPQIASKELSKTSKTLTPNQKLSTPVKVRNRHWKKLRSVFRFMIVIKHVYQKRLASRKQNCQIFYAENYRFVSQSVVDFLRKPVHGILNNLLDMNKNFDIASEIQDIRISYQSLITLKVSSKGNR